ncbi:MAG: hypothetical protein L0G94_03885 [Brachybacterium sp.]|uniref:hypothetical protein n=1 Tax=Brachybacterium sp. TaxID=1891286 RepID=UPI00264899F0|nr:hypothetical protein [Brachybacterium sp.]MDN5685810.1 hypothetical protein [Brachybacterium sp.]
MEYLGSLGRLTGLPCHSEERVQPAARYITETTVEGRRRAQVRPVTPRSWDVVWDLSEPTEIAALTGFISGAWGRGPWVWVPVQAQVGNLLTPRESMLVDRASVSTEHIQDAGPVRDASGGWSARSVTVTITSGWVALARDVPVIAGKPVTFSADVEGSGPEVYVVFYDAAGGQMSTNAAAGSGADMQRVSVTATAPAGSVSANIGLRSTVTRAARPQVTWTAGPVPWSAGQGCRSAIVDGFTEDLLVANRFGPYSQVGFTVMEVS